MIQNSELQHIETTKATPTVEAQDGRPMTVASLPRFSLESIGIKVIQVPEAESRIYAW